MKSHKRMKLDSIEKCDVEEIEDSTTNSALCVPGTSSGNSNVSLPLAGRIEKIQMINFMCHTNLEVKFNERVTFVTGLNGSGKSTIMAALVVVLGGTACTTGRGKGLADFIKKGEKWAKVVLTLINEGKNAYKTEVYGNRIILTRDLSLKSGNSYTCKSKSGKIISKRKNEVDRICAAFDIQIKNPICILNQDAARTFLSTSDGHTRYEIFLKATHLENLQFLYNTVTELLDWAREKLAKKKKNIRHSKRHLKKLKYMLESFVSLEKFVDEQQKLENELLWAAVKEEEKEVDHFITGILEEEKKIELFNESRENFVKSIAKLEENVRKCRKEYFACEERQNDAEKNQEKKKLELEIHSVQQEINEINVRLRDLATKESRLEGDVESTRKQIMDYRHVPEIGSIILRSKESHISLLNNHLEKLKKEIASAEKDKEMGLKNKLQYGYSLGDLRNELSAMEFHKRGNEMFNKSIVYDSARNNPNEDKSALGPIAEELDRLIDKEMKNKKFRKRPIGPCCKYVRIKDLQWAKAVESVIGGLLATYCCDNHEDFQLLSKLMEKVCPGRSPNIIISKFQGTRYSPWFKVNVKGMQTMLDILEISNDVVYNNFIDQGRLETILLFNSDEEASAMLSCVEKVPRHLRMGVTLKCDLYYPAPNYRTYSGDPNRPLKYFGHAAKTFELMKKVEVENEAASLEIEKKNAEIKEMAKKYAKNMEFLERTEKRLKFLKEKENKAEFVLRDVKLDTPMEDNPFQKDFEDLRNKLKAVKESVASEKLKRDNIIRRREGLIVRLKEIRKLQEQWESEYAQLKSKYDRSRFDLKEAIKSKDNIQKDIRNVKVERHRLKRELKAHLKLLDEKMEAAMEAHKERIDTDRSQAEIEKLLKECKRGVKVASENADHADWMGREFDMKAKKYIRTKKDIIKLEDVVDSLVDSAQAKKNKLNSYRKYISNIISFHFQSFLSMRGFNAKLNFNFSDETLEIEITEGSGHKRTDTKTLSGGERSYIMVSFILAIWRAVEMPFYFLDEFDVFMDKMNRKVIMDLLTWHGEKETGKQFIFITPQEVSSIRASDNVSICRLPDPKRTCKEPSTSSQE